MNKIMNIMLKNDFIIPDYNNPNIVDLMRAIYCKYNIKIELIIWELNIQQLMLFILSKEEIWIGII